MPVCYIVVLAVLALAASGAGGGPPSPPRMDVRAGFLGTVHPSRQPAAVAPTTDAAAPCLDLKCPTGSRFIYGGADSGFYCCPEPTSHGDCGSPACTKGGRTKDCACCIFPAPGSTGCQGATKCAGSPPNDPKNTTVCPIRPTPPGPWDRPHRRRRRRRRRPQRPASTS